MTMVGWVVAPPSTMSFLEVITNYIHSAMWTATSSILQLQLAFAGDFICIKFEVRVDWFYSLYIVRRACISCETGLIMTLIFLWPKEWLCVWSTKVIQSDPNRWVWRPSVGSRVGPMGNWHLFGQLVFHQCKYKCIYIYGAGEPEWVSEWRMWFKYNNEVILERRRHCVNCYTSHGVSTWVE